MTQLQPKQQAKKLDNSFLFKRLAVFHHNKKISKYDFRNHPVLLGRSKNNSVVLRSPSISRHHAAIITKNKKTTIKKLSSKNAVYVNKQAIEYHSLTDGDVIRIGEFQLFFTQESSADTSSMKDSTTTSTVAKRVKSQPQKNGDTNDLKRKNATNRRIPDSSSTKRNDQQDAKQRPRTDAEVFSKAHKKGKTATATALVLVALVLLVAIPAILFYTNKKINIPLDEQANNTSDSSVSQNQNQSQSFNPRASVGSQEITAPPIEKKKTDNKPTSYRIDTFYDGELIKTEDVK